MTGRPPIDPRTGRPRKPPRRQPPRQPPRQSRQPPRQQHSRRVAAASRLVAPRAKPVEIAGPRAATLKMGSPRRRLRITMVGLLFAFSLFAGRLFQLQAVDANGYAKAADISRENTAVLFAQRGAIFAADGTPLAVSVEAYDVVADPTKVAEYHQDVDELASKLAAVLATAPEFAGIDTTKASLDVTSLQAELSNTKTQYVVLAKKVSPRTWARVAALTASNTYDSKTTKLAVGLARNRDDRRIYPGGTLAANVVGYTGADGKGQGGIEKMLNGELDGVDGLVSYQAASGVEIPTAGLNEKPAVDGTSVRTTLDPNLQWATQQAISDEVHKSGATSGTVVVEDVATGRILALATAPTFDPAHIAKADVPNIGNRAFTDPYEPGSVAKIVTMSAAIQEGVAQPDTHVPTFANGVACGGAVFHDDAYHTTDSSLTMAGVLARSSNIGTIEIADMFAQHGLSRDATLYKYQQLFGIGATTGIGFPGESAGDLAPPSKWSGTQRCTVTFGQGFAVTAVQAASVYATIANGGIRIAPSLVEGYIDPSGKYTPAPLPTRTRVVGADTASKVAQMLEDVVTAKDGTAYGVADIPGYRVAGKTGTAQNVVAGQNGYQDYTASFVGFAPVDKPSIVVSVSLNGLKQGDAHFGSEVAAPVFKQVMDFALRTKAVPPTGTPNANLPTTY